MFAIPGTTRTKRRYAENVRRRFISFDKLVFSRVDLDVPSEDAYKVIRLGPRQYAVALDDPSLP